MKRTSRTLIMAAAVSGLISGANIPWAHADDSTTNAAAGQAAAGKVAPKEHSCAGQNSCKGSGGCKTDAHACKFQNSCKGKGGCETTQKDIQTWEKQQKDAAQKSATPPAKDATTGQ
jgi:hypothetical protein